MQSFPMPQIDITCIGVVRMLIDTLKSILRMSHTVHAMEGLVHRPRTRGFESCKPASKRLQAADFGKARAALTSILLAVNAMMTPAQRWREGQN